MDFNFLGVAFVSDDLPIEIIEMVNDKMEILAEQIREEFNLWLDKNELELVMDVIVEKKLSRDEKMKIKLTYKGMDNWDRPVYEDEQGKLWKDVDPRKNRKPDLCTSVNNDFYGEPLTNMCYMEKYEDAEIVFIPERVTW